MHYDINEIEDSKKFIWVLKQENKNCINWIGNYIYSEMKTRKKVSEDTMWPSTPIRTAYICRYLLPNNLKGLKADFLSWQKPLAR